MRIKAGADGFTSIQAPMTRVSTILVVASSSPVRALLRAVPVVFAMVCLAACGGNPPVVPAGNTAPDQFPFQRANDAVKRQGWPDARKYFQQIVDNYPQSPLRPDAKIGVGDSYLDE